MKKVKFNRRYGQIEALVAGKKREFQSIEFNLIRYLESHYPSHRVERVGIPLDESEGVTVYLNEGISFGYRPKYKIGEVIMVEDIDVQIKIVGIRIVRLCNLSAKDVVNEGIGVMSMDGRKFYSYPDIEDECLVYFKSHQLAWNSLLYRTHDSDLVLNNPYSVVYQFELI
jgi:hypothetical protein